MSMSDTTGTPPPAQGTAGSTDITTQLQNIVRQLSAIAGATSSGGIPLPLSLANGGLGGDQSGAAEAQVPVYPGSGGAAVPRSLGYANVVWYGADPTGVSDSAAAINAALAASSYIFFPPGIYKINSRISYTLPNALAGVTIAGAGSENTILNWPNANGGFLFTYSGSYKNAVHVNGLTLATEIAGGGNAIELSNIIVISDPALTAQSTIYDVVCRGDGYFGAGSPYWTIGVEIANVSNVQIDALTVVNGSGANLGYGIYVVGLVASTAYAVEINVSSSTFTSLLVGFEYGDYVQGVSLDQCNFTGNTWGVHVASGLTGMLDQLSITNSQFANVDDFQTDTNIYDLQISNCTFGEAGPGNGLLLGQCSTTTIIGNFFNGGASSNGIIIGTVQGGAGVTIVGNNLTGFSGGTAIWLQSGSTSTVITSNYFQNNSTNILNQSTATNNVIANNPGYNPVGVSAPATVGASPATITNGPTPATYYFLQSATNTATVAQGGHTLGTLSSATLPLTVDLGPNESVIVTWATTAPTYTVSVH